jgi:hypothetical protein
MQTRQAFTAEQINEATYVDIHGNKALFDNLRNNPKVKLDRRHFSYKVNELNIVLLTISSRSSHVLFKEKNRTFL